MDYIKNKVHPTVRLNSICPYYTMFPLYFPYSVLKNAQRGDIVFDPFCGRGTTNFAARLHGLSNFGIDSNIVACSIAKAKLIKVPPRSIFNLAKEILADSHDIDMPESEFWNKAYHSQTLQEICKLRDYLNSKKRLSQYDVALKAILLGILHGPIMTTQPSYLSNQMPRTFSTKPDYSIRYWKKHRLKPTYIDTLDLIRRKSEYIFNSELTDKVGGKIINADSRKISRSVIDERVDWVVTSPPYYGMSTYEQDQWLRNWFVGGTEHVDYTVKAQVRHYSEKAFIQDLSKVWKSTASVCNENAKLIIRFGSLPSKSEKTPAAILKESLSLADCGWKIKTIRNAGTPVDSKRQANQFKNDTGSYIEEIDVYASLNS